MTAGSMFKFEPAVIYDIGAFEGVWTEECRKLYPDADYVQFEANTKKRPYLQSNAMIDVLGDKDGEIVDYYRTTAAPETGNSILREQSSFFNDSVCLVEKRTMRTLDSLVDEYSIPLPNFMKLDTQGSELMILRGGSRCLEHAEIVLMEVSLHPLNASSPLIADVLAFMKERGFVMFDIAELDFNAHNLNQIDVLFCRPESQYLIKYWNAVV
jgi:FkbM family methyltransferase